MSFEGLPRALEPGNRVLLDDGKIELRVVGIEGGRIACRVECGGTLRDRKGVNVPDTDLLHQPIDPETHDDLVFAAENDIDYVAASFVQSARDVEQIQSFMAGRGVEIPDHREDRDSCGCGQPRRRSWTRPGVPWWPGAISAWSCPWRGCPTSRSASSIPRSRVASR